MRVRLLVGALAVVGAAVAGCSSAAPPRNGATVTATRVALGKAKPAPTAAPATPTT